MMIDAEQQITVHTNSIVMRLSEDELFYWWSFRFPRYGHSITHPVTDDERRDYKRIKSQWKAAEKALDKVIREAEQRGWGNPHSGYDCEPAELRPLKPRVEWVADETEEDHIARVKKIIDHHEKTGEWMEEPTPTMHEVLMRALGGALDKSAAGLSTA